MFAGYKPHKRERSCCPCVSRPPSFQPMQTHSYSWLCLSSWCIAGHINDNAETGLLWDGFLQVSLGNNSLPVPSKCSLSTRFVAVHAGPSLMEYVALKVSSPESEKKKYYLVPRGFKPCRWLSFYVPWLWDIGFSIFGCYTNTIKPQRISFVALKALKK